ncbi:MAG: hypothetical protein HZB99_02895 [Candidatus Harrisonbacteria bacterium]|nr:hypothetical protein [Candidatus Harrisonbacteria bacterium]
MDSLTGAKLTDEVSVDTSKPKVIGLGVIGVLLSGLFGFFLNLAVLDNGSSQLLPALFSAVAFLIVFLLQTLFIKSKQIIGIIILLESLALTFVSIRLFSSVILSAWFLLILFWWLAVRMGREQLDNQLKIRFFQFEKAVMSYTLTALAIFISIIYVVAGGGMVSEQNIKSILLPAEPLIQKFYFKDFSLNMTMTKLVESLVIKQLGAEAAALPISARNSLISQTVGQLSKQASQYGISFKGTDKIIDVLYGFVFNQIKKIPESFRAAIPIAVGALLFLTLKGVGSLFHWVIAIPAYLVYQLAILTGFARLALESRSREIVVLK